MAGFKFPLFSFFYPSAELYFPGTWNELAKTAVLWLAAGKFMPIFSLLFGIGLALQEKRAIARGRAFGPFICWRMGLLVAAGVIHGILLWPGDILALYGLLGLLSPILIKRSVHTLLLLAIVLSLTSIGLLAFLTISYVSQPQMTNDLRSVVDEWISAYQNASLPYMVALRIQEWKFVWVSTWFSNISHASLFFVLGLALGKSTKLETWLSPGFKVGRLFIFSVVLAAGVSLAAVKRAYGHPGGDLLPNLSTYLGVLIGSWILSWGYIAGFARLYHRSAGSWLMQGFACVGRLSLTNYLLQSLIANVLFMPFGFGLYGRVPFSEGLALSVVIFVLQMIFSRWWLSRYQSGPAEYLWRVLSYPR